MRWLALTALLGAAVACAGEASSTTATASSPGAAVVATDRVVRGSLQQRVLLTGAIRSVDSAEFMVPRTRVWNLSIRWMADDGTAVHQGDRVLEFDNSALTGDLTQKQLMLRQARLDLTTQQALSDMVRSDKEVESQRQALLLKRAKVQASIPKEILSAREYQERTLAIERTRVAHNRAEEELRTQQRTSSLDVEVKRIELDKATRDIASTEQTINELTLTAPRDGIVVIKDHPWEGRRFQIGDTVRPGFSIAELPDLSKIRVEAELSDVDDGSIQVGMPASCTLDAYPNLVFPGKILEISPVANETEQSSLRRSFKVIVELDHADTDKMRPGMSVKVEITLPPSDQLLLAPRAALDLTATPPVAQLDDGSTVTVELGPCNAHQCVITNGLREGDKLRPVGGSL